MEAYYDQDRKVWVFPGENPDEVAKPIGPPPTSAAASTPSSEQAASVSAAATPSQSQPLDPLAAMMAPPPRMPGRSGGVTKARSAATPASLPGMLMSSPQQSAMPPTFAVFQPAPATAGT
jgi:hypothetical protein